MATDAPTAMPTDRHILTLSQWLSPAYPVGAFAYSHGLEALAGGGLVADAAGLREWLTDVHLRGTGWTDALFLAAAFYAEDADEVDRVDQIARAFAPSRERLVETTQQGEAFCGVTNSIWATELCKLTYPVALGHAAALRELPLRLTSKMYLLAFTSNLVAAGQRLLPVGQTEGQAIIRDLTPLCQKIAEATESGDLSQLSSTAFLSDIASMKHEVQYARIFRT